MTLNHYVFSPYRNPDLDDRILFFDCLKASISAVQAEDVCE